MSEKKTLRHKLFLAGKAAQEVGKHGDGDGFKYARAEDVLAEASRVLEKQSIVVIPSVEEVELRFLKNGGAIAKATMSFEVTDTKTGETFTKSWIGTGFDSPGDKAAYAAQTGAEKYFLAKLLSIPFGADPEEDSPEGEAEQIRHEQDAAAEAPDEPPAIKPLPVSDLEEPDWRGLALGEEVMADA